MQNNNIIAVKVQLSSRGRPSTTINVASTATLGDVYRAVVQKTGANFSIKKYYDIIKKYDENTTVEEYLLKESPLEKTIIMHNMPVVETMVHCYNSSGSLTQKIDVYEIVQHVEMLTGRKPVRIKLWGQEYKTKEEHDDILQKSDNWGNRIYDIELEEGRLDIGTQLGSSSSSIMHNAGTYESRLAEQQNNTFPKYQYADGPPVIQPSTSSTAYTSAMPHTTTNQSPRPNTLYDLPDNTVGPPQSYVTTSSSPSDLWYILGPGGLIGGTAGGATYGVLYGTTSIATAALEVKCAATIAIVASVFIGVAVAGAYHTIREKMA